MDFTIFVILKTHYHLQVKESSEVVNAIVGTIKLIEIAVKVGFVPDHFAHLKLEISLGAFFDKIHVSVGIFQVYGGAVKVSDRVV